MHRGPRLLFNSLWVSITQSASLYWAPSRSGDVPGCWAETEPVRILGVTPLGFDLGSKRWCVRHYPTCVQQGGRGHARKMHLGGLR